jgi:hypothetical protein
MADTIRGSGLGWALYALPCLAALGLPAASRSLRLDPEDALVEEFQSICAGYYRQFQCDGAIHFVLRNPGTDYFVQLHNEEVAEIFLEKLITAIKGGEALKASETTALKPAE